jgi:saccharopine dehydrogenase-like NADP-dependent oxidoreductase
MKVAVLGAAGTIARAIVHDLAESAEVDELLLLDRDGSMPLAEAEAQIGGRAAAVELVAPAGLAAAIAGCQVLVNAAGRAGDLEAMEAALAAGCHYVDLDWAAARQVELDERFIAADLIAVLGMGASPGMTNVMAERAVRRLAGERVLAIDVSSALRDLGGDGGGDGGGTGLPAGAGRLVGQLRGAAFVLEDGVTRELEPRSPGGPVDFPPPIGPAETIHVGHAGLETLARSLGVGGLSYRLSLAPALLRRLEELLGASEEDLAAAAAAGPPSVETVAAHVVEARSDRRTARVTAVRGPHLGWGIGGEVVAAAAPVAALVRLLAQGRIEPVGVVPAENAVDPDDLLPELEARDCAFTVEVRDR